MPNYESLPILHQHSSNELGLGPLWADEYLEHSVSADKNIGSNNVTQSCKDRLESTNKQALESPHIEHSKFMKYMHQDSDSTIINNPQKISAISELDEKWSEEYTHGKSADHVIGTDVGALDKANDATAEAWVDELKQENASATGKSDSG